MNKVQLISFVIPSHMPGSGGWGNGYVAIPKGHPLFGVDYDDIKVRVHGGLTFSCMAENDAMKYFPASVKGMWVVGFDTLHSGDDMRRWPDIDSVMKEANALKAKLARRK